MSARDAIEQLAHDWTRVAPLLTAWQRENIERTLYEAIEGYVHWFEFAEAVLGIVADALPPGDPILEAIGLSADRHAGAERGWDDVLGLLRAGMDLDPRVALFWEATAAFAPYGGERVPPQGPPPGAIAVRLRWEYVIPSFQVAEREDLRLHDSVVRVNTTLGAARDPWGVLSWWHRWNGWLGCPPMELLGTDREGEVMAAADMVLEDGW